MTRPSEAVAARRRIAWIAQSDEDPHPSCLFRGLRGVLTWPREHFDGEDDEPVLSAQPKPAEVEVGVGAALEETANEFGVEPVVHAVVTSASKKMQRGDSPGLLERGDRGRPQRLTALGGELDHALT